MKIQKEKKKKKKKHQPPHMTDAPSPVTEPLPPLVVTTAAVGRPGPDLWDDPSWERVPPDRQVFLLAAGARS